MEFNNEMEKRAFLLQTLMGLGPLVYDMMDRSEREDHDALLKRLDKVDPKKGKQVRKQIDDEKYERYNDSQSSRATRGNLLGAGTGLALGAAGSIPAGYAIENRSEGWLALAQKIGDKHPTMASFAQALKPKPEMLLTTYVKDKFGDVMTFQAHLRDQVGYALSNDPEKHKWLTGLHAANFNGKPLVSYVADQEGNITGWNGIALNQEELAHFMATDLKTKYGYVADPLPPMRFLKDKGKLIKSLKMAGPYTVPVGAAIGLYAGGRVAKNNMAEERGQSIPSNSDIHEMILKAESKKPNSPVVEIK